MFHERFTVSLFRHIAKRFVSLVSQKQGCETNYTFRKAATFFSCFAVLRHRNQLFHQKPLSGGVKLTQLLYFETILQKAQYFAVLCNVS